MEKVLKELLLRITGEQLIEVTEKYEDGEAKVKHIYPQDLTELIANNTQMIGVETELPDNACWFREELDGTRRIILKVIDYKADITLFDKTYENVALPNMLFGFSINSDGYVKSKKVICVKDSRVTSETDTFEYPFSNVFKDSKEICMGVNKFNKLDSLLQISSAPYYIIGLPNNDDMFHLTHNTEGLNYRDLLLKSAGKERYDENLLVPTGKKVKDFIKLLKTDK